MNNRLVWDRPLLRPDAHPIAPRLEVGNLGRTIIILRLTIIIRMNMNLKIIRIISGPNENSPKANTSVYDLHRITSATSVSQCAQKVRRNGQNSTS